MIIKRGKYMKKSFMKNSLFRAVLGAAALSLLAPFFSSCKKVQPKNLLEKVKAKGEIVIATEGVWAPWSFHNGKNELVGFDIEVAKELCARVGLKPRFIEVEWDRIFKCLETGVCDIAANGIEVTSERAGSLYFSQPYAYSKTALIVRKDNDKIKSFKDLRGTSSANSLDSTYAQIAESYGAIIIAVNSFEETMNLVLENRADSTINSDVSFYDYLITNPGVPVKIAEVSNIVLPVAIPCKREVENLPLLAELNKALTEMHSDGTLTRISLKYFRKDITK